MSSLLKTRLSQTLLLTDGLAGSLREAQLADRIGNVPSNSIGSQFWCIVGARESYGKAIAASKWQGFSCSLSKPDTKILPSLQAALEGSREEVMEHVNNNEMTAERLSILVDLLEHEALHQGQLIRYFYANNITFPEDFADRYALAQPKEG
jgi:hypothetical protein